MSAVQIKVKISGPLFAPGTPERTLLERDGRAHGRRSAQNVRRRIPLGPGRRYVLGALLGGSRDIEDAGKRMLERIRRYRPLEPMTDRQTDPPVRDDRDR